MKSANAMIRIMSMVRYCLFLVFVSVRVSSIDSSITAVSWCARIVSVVSIKNVIVLCGFFIVDIVSVRRTSPSIRSCMSHDVRRFAIESVVIIDVSNDFVLFHCR